MGKSSRFTAAFCLRKTPGKTRDMHSLCSLSPKKKAQMEILGLSIIMILLTLMALFAFVFLAQKSGTDFSLIHDRQKVNSLMSVIQLASTECGDSLVNLIKDCAQQPNLYCNGQNSCNYAKEQISKLLDESLEGRQYYFMIKGTSFVEQITTGHSCQGEKQSKETNVLVSINFPITLHLEVCR